jgi:hypothetical protein
MERKKITRREFLKKAGMIAAGALGAKGLYELTKEIKRKIIENAPEGIYYLLTGKKIDLEGITKENFQQVLENLKENLEKSLKVKIEIKEFNLDEGIKSLQQEKGTVILVLWPTRDYPPTIEPSLGILEKAEENYIKVWDPNRGEVEYIESLEKWREQKRPIIYLGFEEKIEISKERKKEIERSIKESREAP